MRAALPARLAVRAFTLIEVLVVVTVIAVLLMVVAPSFAAALLSTRLTSYSNAWVANAQLARSESIKRNATVTLCASFDGRNCASAGTWQQGWLLKASDGTVVTSHEALSGDYSFTGSSYSLDFQPSGVGSTSSVLTLCRALPAAGNQERVISLTSTGRASVTTTKAGSCG